MLQLQVEKLLLYQVSQEKKFKKPVSVLATSTLITAANKNTHENAETSENNKNGNKDLGRNFI